MMRLWVCGQRPCVVHIPTGGTSGFDRATGGSLVNCLHERRNQRANGVHRGDVN